MGQDVRVTPESWTARGEARVRGASGRDLLVFGGIPGEPADVWVQHSGQHQALGLWRSSPTPHEHRVEPPCDRYTPCGGCPLMHLDQPGQERARRALVRAALDGEGLDDVTLGAWHASPDGEDAFRHVVKVGAGYSDHGHVRVGAWGRRSRSIVPIPKCPVATPTLRRAMSSIAHHVIELGIKPYDPESDRGVLRAVVARQSRSSGEVLLTLVVGRRVRALVDLAEALAQDVTEVVGVWAHVNDDPGNAIYSRDEDGAVGVRPLLGRSWIEDVLNGVSYRIGPGDFFQTNPSVAEVLYRRTLDGLKLVSDSAFVDLYAGVGGLALQAASRGVWSMGVEGLEGAVLRARDAAHRNELTAEFVCGDVGALLPDVKRRLAGRRPMVAINPARRGLEEGVVERLIDLEPRRIAYISCNPRALAHDLASFRAHGYQIGEVELFDMFPNTAHVETLVVLTGEDPDAPTRRAPKRRVVRAR
ncbi:MAG: 23S rRNA (uracil(1939)-C(5))-methyltransferase RlmD [Deltaproteobacteria bacterium]|nr:MAG: 23S rRNA (uracil(1939)-C(5))-methyltransferase RlmD [Deltaproteobacteria bacterium]